MPAACRAIRCGSVHPMTRRRPNLGYDYANYSNPRESPSRGRGSLFQRRGRQPPGHEPRLASDSPESPLLHLWSTRHRSARRLGAMAQRQSYRGAHVTPRSPLTRLFSSTRMVMRSKSRITHHTSPTTAAAMPPMNMSALRQQLEDHVRGHPLKSLGQAAVAGYALRFLPLRSLLGVGLRVAAPLLCLGGLWKACERLEK